MPVITISRQFGIGGIELTEQISQSLGYPFYSKEIAAEIAEKMGLDYRVVHEYQDQMAHKSNWKIGAYAGRLALFETSHIQEKEYHQIVVRTIRKFAQADNVIILGSGGQCILHNQPDTFHFRIIANMKTRVNHIISHYRNPEDIPPRKMLEHRINNMDKLRRKFVETHYKMSIEDTELYHSVFNLSKLSSEVVSALIIKIVQS